MTLRYDNGLILDNLGQCIADVAGPDNSYTGRERKAHGYLLAAAPQLLAACEALLNCADSNRDWKELKAAHAAIAAAKPPALHCCHCGAAVESYAKHPLGHEWYCADCAADCIDSYERGYQAAFVAIARLGKE